MRIGLIIPTVKWLAPYLNIYTSVLDEMKINYQIISFNRKNEEESTDYHFDYKLDNTEGFVSKMKANLRYSLFVRKVLEKEKYDKLIVFGPQIGIFLLPYLYKNYKKKFIFDYRDLSIDKYFPLLFKWLLRISEYKVLSSPGFMRFMPKTEKEFYLSHNFDINNVVNAIKSDILPCPTAPYNILTIGGIRDYESNVEVIKGLANKRQFNISFVGRGYASDLLKKFCEENNVSNCSFVGYYDKHDEPGYVKGCAAVNIFYPRKPSHDTALSNRFYNALIFKRPMITTANTTQGDYAEKYSVGLSLDNCDNLADDLENFYKNVDYCEFCQNCNELLKLFLDDYDRFVRMMKDFVS